MHTPNKKELPDIYNLDLSTKIINILLGEGIRTIAQLREYDNEHIWSLATIPGIGPISMADITKALNK